ncbi:MAG: exopolyphosphatase [Thermoanaerobaculia bacterium]|nr:exopolyphosphatase [Thermoanaerobaculia bacterium]
MEAVESPPEGSHLAAVDLGSNSFRMVIARSTAAGLEPIDQLWEGVRLAASLNSARELSEEGQERALAALSRFGQRIRDFSASNVRAVGTNTLRKAKNAAAFLERAEAALGHPIEVVSGQEEARLIYLGVGHSVPPASGRRLVVDIGGGSTEIVIGKKHRLLLAESLFMGCVSWSQKYFPKGKITKAGMKRADLAARLEVQPGAKAFRRSGWTHCYGSSGTVKAIETVLVDSGWSQGGITLAGLKELRKALLAGKNMDDLSLPGLSSDRSRVLPGGLAILMGIFRSLGIEQMAWSPGALREGLLYDLQGRLQKLDVRDETISRFVERYLVDLDQADRVEDTFRYAFGRAASSWGLSEEQWSKFIGWAARLHEIGIVVGHSGYHRHGAYLVENSDLPGFSRQNQSFLSVLIRGHRRKIRRDQLTGLPEAIREPVLRLCLLFRLAVLLNRSRSSRPLPEFSLATSDRELEVTFPKGWLARHPLTREDLGQEAKYLKSVGYKLRFS